MIRACAYASGYIVFGKRVPAGATIIARGPEELLRAFLERHARRHVRRRGRHAGTSHLLVPGMPEAASPVIAVQRFNAWCEELATNAPAGVRVLPR